MADNTRSLFDLVEDTEPRISVSEADVHHDGRSFAAEVIGSLEYRQSIKRRIQNDDLPPQIELFLLHTFYGKPTERKEITLTEGVPDLTKLSDEELERELLNAGRRLKNAQAAESLLNGPGPRGVM